MTHEDPPATVDRRHRAIVWRVRVAALAAVVALSAVFVYGLLQPHSHGDLRIRDGEGRVVLASEWRPGSDGRELVAVTRGEYQFELPGGSGEHDLVVVRAGQDATALPTRDGRVDLERTGEVLTTVGTGRPGESDEQGPVFLDTGEYVLFCDRPNHYEAGMYYRLSVE